MCVKAEGVREMTLIEEIGELKAYGVPQNVIDRMLRKAGDAEKWHKKMIANREKTVRAWAEKDRNSQAVINALGSYISKRDPIVDTIY